MKLSYLAAAAALSVALAQGALAQNLVQNPGFETGNLDGWSAGDPFILAIADFAHTGTWSLYMGSNKPNRPMNQALATTPGETYDVSFWLENIQVHDPLGNHFSAFFGGTPGMMDGQLLLDVTNLTRGPYVMYSDVVTANSSTTLLQFFENNANDIFYLDDVSVTVHGAGSSVPEPGALALLTGLGVSGSLFAVRRLRRRGK